MGNCVKKNPKVVATVQGDELILLNPESGKYFGANQTGGVIWSLLSKFDTVDQIVSELAKEFEEDQATIKAAVEQFLGVLRERELILEDP